jgi:hypothetical protein
MSVSAGVVSVTTAATLLAAPASSDSDGITVQFTPPSAIYVGGADVTASTTAGYLLTAGVEYTYDLKAGNPLYAISPSGTVVVPVLRTGV